MNQSGGRHCCHPSGCTRPLAVKSVQLCSKHYRERRADHLRRRGQLCQEPVTVPNEAVRKLCGKIVQAGHVCMTHYQRDRRARLERTKLDHSALARGTTKSTRPTKSDEMSSKASPCGSCSLADDSDGEDDDDEVDCFNPEYINIMRSVLSSTPLTTYSATSKANSWSY